MSTERSDDDATPGAAEGAEVPESGEVRGSGEAAGRTAGGDARGEVSAAEARTARRYSSLVALVAAAVLVVGGGGAYLAASAGGGFGGSDSGAPATSPAVQPTHLTEPAPPSPAPQPVDPGDPPDSAPRTRDVRIEGYTVEGRNLTVSFWGGVCSEYSVSAAQESGKVTVAVTEKPLRKVCILIAKVVERTVQLDEPLGDRKVVGTNGKEIPKGSVTDGVPGNR